MKHIKRSSEFETTVQFQSNHQCVAFLNMEMANIRDISHNNYLFSIIYECLTRPTTSCLALLSLDIVIIGVIPKHGTRTDIIYLLSFADSI